MIFLPHISISISHEVLWKGWEEEQVLLANTHSVVFPQSTDQGEGSQQEKCHSHNFHGVILKQLMPTLRMHASLTFISSA